MSTFMDAIAGGGKDDPNKGGQGRDAVWINGRWVPKHIAAPTTSRLPTTRRPGGGPPTRPDSKDEEANLPYEDPLTKALGPGATRAQVEEYVRNNYGYLGAFMDVPEVGSILYNAAVNGWSEGKLKGALYQTSWWKNTSAAQRTWQQLVAEDPAEARRQVAQNAATINDRARSLGLGMSAGQISSIASMATANGWNDSQRIDYLIGQVNWSTLQGGDLTAMRDDVKAIGSNYLTTVSEQTAQNYAMRMASGELTQEGVASIMRNQAKARFGYLAEEIDQGISVKDYFMPIRDTIARELGLNAEAVDMMDPKWLGMMETKGDDGKVRAATLNEAMLSARKRPEFAGSQKAQEMGTQLTGVIADMFGRRGV